MAHRLKPFVNSPEFQEAFKEYLEGRIEIARQNLEAASDEKRMYKIQGEIGVYRRLLSLREEINGETNGLANGRRS